MERKKISGLTLFFDTGEQDAADLVASACEKSASIIRETWRLDVPADCRVYVMRSWLHFVFHSAPWPWRILLGATLPLWGWRARRFWAIAGGFHQAYGRRRAVGVKPPRLIRQANQGIGARIFVPEEQQDMQRKVQHNTCHELTHACTAHLRLPMWLNEGLAMVTVDVFAESQTIRQDTLDALDRASSQGDPIRYQDVKTDDTDGLVYHTVRGYWLTRYLDDQQPELLKRLLEERRDPQVLQSEIGGALGIDVATFWRDINRVIVSHFGQTRSD